MIGKSADTSGRARSLMVLAGGLWSVGRTVAFGCSFVYPREAEQLRRQMSSRREMIVRGAEQA